MSPAALVFLPQPRATAPGSTGSAGARSIEPTSPVSMTRSPCPLDTDFLAICGEPPCARSARRVALGYSRAPPGPSRTPTRMISVHFLPQGAGHRCREHTSSSTSGRKSKRDSRRSVDEPDLPHLAGAAASGRAERRPPHRRGIPHRPVGWISDRFGRCFRPAPRPCSAQT